MIISQDCAPLGLEVVIGLVPGRWPGLSNRDPLGRKMLEFAVLSRVTQGNSATSKAGASPFRSSVLMYESLNFEVLKSLPALLLWTRKTLCQLD
jgi:hypothetical protein